MNEPHHMISRPGDPAFGSGVIDYWSIYWKHDWEDEYSLTFFVADNQFDATISRPDDTNYVRVRNWVFV